MIIAELPDLLTRLRGQIQAAEADTPSGYIAVVEMRAAEMSRLLDFFDSTLGEQRRLQTRIDELDTKLRAMTTQYEAACEDSAFPGDGECCSEPGTPARPNVDSSGWVCDCACHPRLEGEK